MHPITTIALDADDTLWQNEQFFRLTEQRFAELLAPYTDAPDINARLIEAVKKNLSFYGFGMKGFALSMVETALDVTDHRVPGTVIAEILAAGRELLSYPIETLPYVDQALAQLQNSYRLLLVTKGDIFDQERKIAASGLADYFAAVEILADKTPAAYARVFKRHADGAERTVMVGNSLRSDVLPALQAGSFAIYVPHDLTWSYEHAEEPVDEPRYAKIAHLGELEAAIAAFEAVVQ
jgi:putative hydrolase of the HAD superfamily